MLIREKLIDGEHCIVLRKQDFETLQEKILEQDELIEKMKTGSEGL